MSADRPPADPLERTGEVDVLGWREWVRLPELGVDRIKAKVDTGARSSSLHAFDVERVERDGETLLRFQLHPVQRDDSVVVDVEMPLHDERRVRPSTGRQALRPVIVTDLEVAGRRFPVEITLANRDRMGFRMLLGREALAGRFLVDPGASFRAGGTRRRPPGAAGEATTGPAREGPGAPPPPTEGEE